MKLTESRIKEIIKEEINRVNEEEMNSETLEPQVTEIIKKLTAEEQAIVNQYITALKGN
tara:strand:- start:651 stop:827 length:177 start_codon:yes stop_codon:yes gene_type:complete